MVCVKTLPFLEGAKTIIIDEGMEAMYGRMLLAAWLQSWKLKDPNSRIELMSFSQPKTWYQTEPEPFTSGIVTIADYYTLPDKPLKDERDRLTRLLENGSFKTPVIIDCLSSLIVYCGLAKALWFVEKLSRKAQQVICIYKRDFVNTRVPCIETMGTTYLRIERHDGVTANNDFCYIVKLTHRKLGGSVLSNSIIITQNNLSYEISSEKVTQESIGKDKFTNNHEEIESSFRIKINAQEMKQRDQTPLPYTLNSNISNSSKIIYDPDEGDDIDEEDPDNDLCF